MIIESVVLFITFIIGYIIGRNKGWKDGVISGESRERLRNIELDILEDELNGRN